MNERIEELAKRAWLEGGDDTHRGKKTAMEKFAELLLRECYTKLENSYSPDDCIPVEEVILCLKEHFEMKD